MNTARLLTLALAAGLAAATLPAVTLVTYDFEDTGDLLKPDAASIATGVSAGAITLNNLGTGTGSGYYTYGSNRAITLLPGTAQTSYSVSTVLSNATYLSIKLTVEEGYRLSIDTLSLQAAAGGSAGTHRAFYVFSDLTQFTAPVGSAYANVLLFDRRNQSGFPGTLPIRSEGLKDYSVTLTDSAFKNIAGGTEVEFRIYIQTDSIDRSVDFGNITLTGTLTPIPEPATNALLLALGALAVAGLCRIRSRHDRS
ncbi:anchor protein [Opitutaceae bacterium TAV5]|nr:anchor protein [Opitutaceae bacterium TAV5]